MICVDITKYLVSTQSPSCTILALDHTCKAWSAWEYSSGTRTLKEASQDLDTTGNAPRLHVKRDKCFKAFLVHTNPLLFQVTSTGVTEVDIEEMENLRALALALGSTASAALAVAGNGTVVNARGEPDSVVREFRLRSGDLLDDLAGIGDVAKALSDAIALCQRRSQATIARVQAVESGDAPTRPIEYSGQDFKRLTALFDELGDVLDKAQARDLRCERSAAAMTALRGAQENASQGNGGNHDQRVRLIREQLVESHLRADGCGKPDDCPNCTDVTDEVLMLASELSKRPKHWRSSTPKRLDAIATFAAVAFAKSDAIAKGQELYMRRGEVTKLAASLRILAEREERFAYGDDPGSRYQSLTRGIIPFERAQGTKTSTRWHKYRRETFKVERDPGLKDQIVANHSDADLVYELQQKHDLGFGVNLGVTYTSLVQPKWAAVPDAMQPSQNIVQQVGEDSKAGRVALFLQAEPWPQKTWAVGLQVGAPVDNDDPGLFLGVSSRLYFFILGVGGTGQEVKELDGTKVGHVVPSSDAIRTKDAWDWDWYVSFAVGIDELPFFKK